MADTPIIWRVNRRPRFPVLDLGEYMATDDGQRETMRRNLKYERLAPTILYSALQQAVASFLTSPTRDRGILVRCRQYLEEEEKNATSPQKRDNATYAIRALDAFERSINALPIAGINLAKAPVSRPYEIDGVKISIQPTALIKVMRPRGAPLRGALVVDLAKGIEPKGDDLKRRATLAMQYTSIMLHEHVNNVVLADGEKPSADHCMTFHSYRQELVTAPANYQKMIRIMRATLRTAKAMWDDIEPPASFNPKQAKYRD